MWKGAFTQTWPPFAVFPQEVKFNAIGLWNKEDFNILTLRQRLHVMSATFAAQGNGGVSSISLLFYVLKAILYAFIFLRICVHPTDSPFRTYVRLLVLTLMWEAFGIGSGSGPFNGKLFPPVLTGFLHFIYLGTAKWPLLKSTWTLKTRRDIVDVGLFALFLHLASTLVFSKQAVSDEDIRIQILSLLMVSGLLGMRDATFMRACPKELFCTLALATLFDKLQIISLGMIFLWMEASVELVRTERIHDFCVDMSSHPLLPSFVKKQLYGRWPTQLNPSAFSNRFHKCVQVLDCSFPICLLLNGKLGAVLFFLHVVVHGQSLEWMVYSFFSVLLLFHQSGAVFLSQIKALAVNPWLGLEVLNELQVMASISLFELGVLIGFMVVYVLASRRYGRKSSSPCTLSFVLVKRSAIGKLNKLWTFSELPHQQLLRCYLAESVEQWEYRQLGKVALELPFAIQALILMFEARDWNDDDFVISGKCFASTLLGSSFSGLDKGLVKEVQSRCDFERYEFKLITMDYSWEKGVVSMEAFDEASLLVCERLFTREELENI